MIAPTGTFIQRTLAVIALLASCSSAAPAFASDESYKKLVQGVSQLQQGNDPAALELFQTATKIDPKDSQAWLFTGTAFNQLGKPSEALESLDKASDLGCADPELQFQIGRAQLGTGDAKSAIKSLVRFESVKPGRGQTSEFLGRAYLQTGDFAKAGAAFQEALRRDPGLRSTVLPYQAELARLQNDQQSAQEKLDDLTWFAPDSATARMLHEDAISHGQFVIGEASGASPLKLSVALSGGWNSDVRGLDVVTVTGNTQQASSGFDSVALSGSYTWSQLTATPGAASPDQLTAGLSVLLNDYPQATSGDFLSGVGSIEYRQPLGGPVSASLKLTGGYDSLTWRGFRESIAGRAALQWRLSDRLLLEPAYTGAHDNYLYDSPPVQNPSAISHTFSLDAFWNLSPRATPADQIITARIGGFYVINRSEGSDFDFLGGGIIVGLEVPLVEHIRAQVLYSWAEDRYENLNSLTIAPGDIILQVPLYQRNDFSNSVTVRLNRQMREWDRHLTVFAEYQYTRNISNISAYEFSQHVVSVGVQWDL